jgi:hypothetical protein
MAASSSPPAEDRGEDAAAHTPSRQAPCGCKWYEDGTTYKCLSHRAATVEPHLPDPTMGIWTDGGDIVWLPLRYYPNRLGAFRFAKTEWGADPREVFVTREWMRFDGLVDEEERWVACEGDAPGAFACWRLEAA